MKFVVKTLVTACAMSLTMDSNVQASDQLELSLQQPSIAGSPATASEIKKVRREVSETANYIVRLRDPSLAKYKGGVAGLSATNPESLGQKRLNVNSKASIDYREFLVSKQSDLVAHCEESFARDIAVKRKFQHILNGVVMELTADEAKMIAQLPDVLSVQQERMELPMTDVGPKWVGAETIYNGSAFFPGTKGEGAVVAVLDTGINSDHPSFADIGGDGYDHTNPLGSGNYIPGSHCDANPDFCNDKLIGAWDMVQDPVNDPTAPEDSDGHGSHTASTAAGNMIADATLSAPTADFVTRIGGVAPHANIIAYDVCVNTCPGSALLGALEQVVIDAAALPDGIHALNYSISGGGDPYNDAVEMAFLNVTAAGILVVASAGNSGPGPATTGHNSPWVNTSAAMTHNRRIVNSVTGLSSDDSPLADIEGLGFTASYGPATIINSADLEADFPGSTLCGLGALGDFNPPWPAGTFNGEIVACTRGTFGRVEKGANVLAAGAGGYILMDNGGGIVGDPHVLPGVHISQDDGAVLADWIANNDNPMGSISGFSLDLDKSNGDLMAGFSSRGPNSTLEVIKPDLGSPGVSIFAAVNSSDTSTPPEYGFLSGTSMSSPHNAGGGALVAVATDWNPYEIKSALMMTANTKNMYKEDGVTPVDHFDVGAGRMNLKKVLRAGLVLDETPENFANADPALGGDPKTLNIASMQNNACVGTCTWTRTVTNSSDMPGAWRIRGGSLTDGMSVSVSPGQIELAPGESASIDITANTATAPDGWSFGGIKLTPTNKRFVDLTMPVAAQAASSTSANLSKTVDLADAVQGDVLNYDITVTNGQMVDTIDISDMLPAGVEYVEGSASGTITNGTEVAPLSVSGNELTWSFDLDVSSLAVNTSAAPFGYFSLASLGVAPFGCPTNCDDGAFTLNVPAFDYNGQTYTQVIWSVNGTIEAGAASGTATSYLNQQFPDSTAPNNLLAPFWTDLNLGAGGNWYVAVLTAGPNQYTVYEWENAPQWSNPAVTFTFQVWVLNGTDQVWFVYEDLPSVPFFTTVGAENDSGTIGASYYSNGVGTLPAVGTDLTINSVVGGTATASFQAEITNCKPQGEAKVNEVNLTSGATAERAIAVTSCTKQ